MPGAAARIPVATNGAAASRPEPRVPGEVGIWLFVAGDLLVFGVFFVVIALGQVEQPGVFDPARAKLDVRVGVINTLLLLTGSLLVALGANRCRAAGGAAGSRFIGFAILCGALFAVNKGFEWGAKVSSSITPATNDFYMYFFIFTGIHLLHVLVGLGVLLLVRRVCLRSELSARDRVTMESGATFWHLVDLLWILLFALFYLI